MVVGTNQTDAENMFKAGGFVPKDVIDTYPEMAVQYGYAKATKPTAEPSITSLSSKEFGAKVQSVADQYPHGYYGNKVFISDLHEHFAKSEPTLTPEAFKQKLLDANMNGALELVRIDEVDSAHPKDILGSETKHPYGAVFHAVLTANNPQRTNRYTPEEIKSAWAERLTK